MTPSRYQELMENDGFPADDSARKELTAEEIAAGWHWCLDFDGLLVGPGMGELEHCTCFDPNGELHPHENRPPLKMLREPHPASRIPERAGERTIA
jgi:hypothetical protein